MTMQGDSRLRFASVTWYRLSAIYQNYSARALIFVYTATEPALFISFDEVPARLLISSVRDAAIILFPQSANSFQKIFFY